MQLTDVLLLNRVKGVGNQTLVKLIKYYRDNNLKTIRDFDFEKITKLKQTTIDAIKSKVYSDEYETLTQELKVLIAKWNEAKIDVFAYGTNNYPCQLNSLPEPPALLFCKGNVDLLKENKSIAVVGTRNCTRVGEKIAYKTVAEFSKKGFCIVSGLALGIDTIAHQAALDHEASTIAVLVDIMKIAPSSNRDLAEKILVQGGLLVSENEPGTKAIPAHFIKRDRIQAGLSLAVFAIETSIDGGTMHAVNAAYSMKRKVFVPNANAAGYTDLNIKQISGTQELVQSERATPYTRENYRDIYQELNLLATSFEDTAKGQSNLL